MLSNFSKFSLYLNMLPEFWAALLIYDLFWLLKVSNCIMLFLCVKLDSQIVIWELISCHLGFEMKFWWFIEVNLAAVPFFWNWHFQSVCVQHLSHFLYSDFPEILVCFSLIYLLWILESFKSILGETKAWWILGVYLIFNYFVFNHC